VNRPALMTVQRDISYSPDAGEAGVGDLFLPEQAVGGAPVLLIHGGGWKGMRKEDFEFMVPHFLERGHPVFNINYRLIGTAPWPACGEDCEMAGRFLLRGGLHSFGLPTPSALYICGGSAGGHLAMMTGLRLPRESVKAILSMAGPSRIDWVAENRDPLGLHRDFIPQFFGRELALKDKEVRAASPALEVEDNPPHLFCFHSKNDLLVPLMQTEEACAAWKARGGRAEMMVIDGHGDLHGFWIDSDRDRLRPEVRNYVHYALTHSP
jgi:acetyl esterase/lipase